MHEYKTPKLPFYCHFLNISYWSLSLDTDDDTLFYTAEGLIILYFISYHVRVGWKDEFSLISDPDFSEFFLRLRDEWVTETNVQLFAY